MAFMDKVQSLLQKMKPQEEEPGMRSNLNHGGFSGYHPTVKDDKKKTKENPQDSSQFSGRQPVEGMSHMVPPGVNPSVLDNMQNMVGQTGHMQQGQPMNGQAMPNQNYQQNWGYQQQAANTGYQQQAANTGYQQHQQQAPFTGYQQTQQQAGHTSWQQAQTPQYAQPQQYAQSHQQQAQPQQQPVQQQASAQPNNIYCFPDQRVVMDEKGNTYRMLLRVAQITGVNSCYDLIEFMQNQEAVIVNAEYITDKAESDRCFDMLFGAAYAMQQRFSRISGRQIYLITPKDLLVKPCDRSSKLGMEDMRSRWPGSLQTEQGRSMQQQGRVDDFAGVAGRRAPLGSQPAGMYTDFGGFGGFGNHG